MFDIRLAAEIIQNMQSDEPNDFRRDSEPSTSTSLLLRAVERDPEAWERIVQLYGPLVYRWCRKSMGEEDTQDLFQEIFQTVASKLMTFKYGQEGSTFRGWLRVMTRNKIIDEARRQQRRNAAAGGSDAHQRFQQLPDDVTVSADEDTAEVESDQVLLMRRGLEVIRDDFSDDVWMVFTSVAVDGRSNNNVAEETGRTAKNVRGIVSRVRKRLREELSHFGDFPSL